MLWMIGLSAAATLLVLFLLARRNEQAVKRDWQLILSPKGQQLYRTLEGKVLAEKELADVAWDGAFNVRRLGSMDEALHLLEVGYKVIERFSPGMLRLLASMAVFSRMVAAMAPVPPLRPHDFRLAQLASLAHLNRLLHQFLVSSAERFRLRLYILGQSFGLATRALVRSTERLVGRHSDAEREWDQLEAIRHDFGTLTDESLQSLRALLASLAAQDRERVLGHIEGS